MQMNDEERRDEIMARLGAVLRCGRWSIVGRKLHPNSVSGFLCLYQSLSELCGEWFH